ncbi:hypothetical protein BDF22DRAFT_664374, partial [Syncephalis plumigaleata]
MITYALLYRSIRELCAIMWLVPHTLQSEMMTYALFIQKHTWIACHITISTSFIIIKIITYVFLLYASIRRLLARY